MIMTGVAGTGGSIESLNRFARCSGNTSRVKKPRVPTGTMRITSPLSNLQHSPAVQLRNAALSDGENDSTRALPGRPPRRERRWVGCGLGDLAQPVAIGVAKRLGLAGNDQQRLLLVRPRSVRVDVDRDRAAIRAERLLQKRIGDDAVG